MATTVPFIATPQPHLASPEAEAALLGALLIDGALIGALRDRLNPDDFYHPAHGRILAEILLRHDRGEKVSPVTIKDCLQSNEDLQSLGGVAYLARLTSSGEGLIAPHSIAAQIQELAGRRRLQTALCAALDEVADTGKPFGEIALPSVDPQHVNGWRALDLAALAKTEPVAAPMAIERLAPAGEVTLFTGAGSAGKSLLGQQAATAAAAGLGRFLGLGIVNGPAIYLTCEDPADQLHFRQAHLCHALGIGMEKLAGRLHLHSLRGELSPALATIGADGLLQPSAALHRLRAAITNTGARLVVLDNVAHLFPGNENDRGEVTRFVGLLNRLTGETGAAIILIGHPNKGGDSYSGSTAWLNAVRSHIAIETPQDRNGEAVDPDARALTIGKANYSRKGQALAFRWHEWAFVREEDLPDDKAANLRELSVANAENEAFLACLRQRAAEGIERAVGPNSGANYAPSQFEGMPQAKGFKRDSFKGAMDRLYAVGRIRSATVQRPAKSGTKTIIEEVGDDFPNASPNASRTLFPNGPERPPITPERVPNTHPSPTERDEGGALKAPPPSSNTETDRAGRAHGASSERNSDAQ